jgi:hypothetical protein
MRDDCLHRLARDSSDARSPPTPVVPGECVLITGPERAGPVRARRRVALVPRRAREARGAS